MFNVKGEHIMLLGAGVGIWWYLSQQKQNGSPQLPDGNGTPGTVPLPSAPTGSTPIISRALTASEQQAANSALADLSKKRGGLPWLWEIRSVETVNGQSGQYIILGFNKLSLQTFLPGGTKEAYAYWWPLRTNSVSYLGRIL